MEKKKNPAAVVLGGKGGKSTKKRGRDYYVKLGKKSAKKRWGTKLSTACTQDSKMVE